MIIGVTGGVGSGKSLVLDILNVEYGAYILRADDIGKDLMQPGQKCFNDIINLFGEEILCQDPEDPEGMVLDRAKISKIVFSDSEMLKKQNDIIHPAVKEEILEQIKKIYALEFNALIVIETAILIEVGYEELIDELWYIYTEKEVRIKRLAETRGYTREKCELIMGNQLSEEEFRAHADFVVDNSLSIEETRKQVDKRMEELFGKA